MLLCYRTLYTLQKIYIHLGEKRESGSKIYFSHVSWWSSLSPPLPLSLAEHSSLTGELPPVYAGAAPHQHPQCLRARRLPHRRLSLLERRRRLHANYLLTKLPLVYG